MTAREEANVGWLLVGRHLAAGRGAQHAVVDPDGAWTYAELDGAAAGLAGALAALGVGRGDRVAIVLPDGRGWAAAFLAITRIGAVAAPMEPGGRNLASSLEDLEAAAAVADAAEPLPGFDGPRLTPDARDVPADLLAVRPDELAYMIFSSGSTGRPKGAMHGHRDLAASVEGYAREVLALGPGDRCHSVAKLFASLGFGNGFFRPLGRGATCVMSPGRPNVRSVLGLVAREGVTVLTGVPTFWAQLATYLDRRPAEAAPLAGLRTAVSSGDSLPAEVLRRVARYAGVDLLEGLGCSECSNIVCSTRPGAPMPGTVGTLVGGVAVSLRDDAGFEVPDGAPGRLWIRSPSNTTGYWRRPEETADVVHGEWIRMGDVLRRDGGVYRHLGRVDDLFKVDARWVSPVEVEDVLHEHPAVAAAAVVGRTDGDGLVRVAAFVETADRAGDGLAAELRRLVAHRLGAHTAPATVTFVDELPRGATGKVDRRALRG